MVVIRLTRGGAHKRPFYHIVAADSRCPRDGRNLEKLGYFNPLTDEPDLRLRINIERIDYWVSHGAQPSPRVKSLLKEAKKMQLNATKVSSEKPAKKVKAATSKKAPTHEDKAESQPTAESTSEE